MKIISAIVITFLMSDTKFSPLTIDFGKGKSGNDWYVVNDGVMGGLSSSNIKFTENSMIFEGVVSLENNGGFASVRSSTKSLDLSKHKTVTIRFRSPSITRVFSLRLNTNDTYYKPSYNQKFQSISNDWQEITFSLDGFKETILGRETGAVIAQEQLKKIIRLGIMLNDKKEGSFSIEIDSITIH